MDERPRSVEDWNCYLRIKPTARPSITQRDVEERRKKILGRWPSWRRKLR